MRSSDWLKIPVVVGLTFFLLGSGSLAEKSALDEAESLLKGPEITMPQALRVLEIYENLLPQATAQRTNILTRLAQVCFLLGEESEKTGKQKYFEQGRTYAELLCREQPAWADGHYWLALHLCGLAEVEGPKRGFRLLPTIVQELELALVVDETYDQGGPHRVLGRIYYEAPAWPLSVGDLHKSLAHLSTAVQIAPENSTNHLYLAETLFRLGKKAEACRELERVLHATQHALCSQGLQEDHRKARRLLEEWAVSGGQASFPDTPVAQASEEVENH